MKNRIDSPVLSGSPALSPARPGASLQSQLPRRISSMELLGEAREVVIQHGSDEYRLRLTSQNKLILNK